VQESGPRHCIQIHSLLVLQVHGHVLGLGLICHNISNPRSIVTSSNTTFKKYNPNYHSTSTITPISQKKKKKSINLPHNI
jgi:hypothetical protein